MIDQALAAPVCGSDFLLAIALASAGVVGIGSQLQRSAPVRASKARTTPAGMAAR